MNFLPIIGWSIAFAFLGVTVIALLIAWMTWLLHMFGAA